MHTSHSTALSQLCVSVCWCVKSNSTYAGAECCIHVMSILLKSVYILRLRVAVAQAQQLVPYCSSPQLLLCTSKYPSVRHIQAEEGDTVSPVVSLYNGICTDLKIWPGRKLLSKHRLKTLLSHSTQRVRNKTNKRRPSGVLTQTGPQAVMPKSYKLLWCLYKTHINLSFVIFLWRSPTLKCFHLTFI